MIPPARPSSSWLAQPQDVWPGSKEGAQAVTDLMEQGAPAFDTAVPMLSQLLKAELAEREVRSIHCPAVHVYMHERGLSHEVRAVPGLQGSVRL